jgi:phenylalanyl-tRNA synthetase beta chain
VVDEATTWGEVRAEIEAASDRALRAQGPMPLGLEEVALRDVYRGPQAGEGKKSFAVRVVFRSATGTLSDAEIDRAVGRIEGRLRHRFGAALRT